MDLAAVEGARRATGTAARPIHERKSQMGRESKFTDQQKYEIALDLMSGKMSHAEVCRKWDISSTYAYKLKDRALELLRNGMGKPVGKADPEVNQLKKKVTDLEELAGDQALAIRYLKKTRGLD